MMSAGSHSASAAGLYRYGRLPGSTVRHRVLPSVLLRMHVCDRRADFITRGGREEWGFENG